MTSTSPVNVGIRSMGAFLPEEVRTNDWWPGSAVEQWFPKDVSKLWRGQRPAEQASDGPFTDTMTRANEAMAEYRGDPFRGARRRHVMPKGMLSSDMEVAAAREALAAAGLEPEQVDFLIVQSAVPDFLGTGNACAVHQRLSLPGHCFCLATETMCNSFLVHLWLAEQLVRQGRSHGLLVQSSGMSPTLDINDPSSALFGDGATAAVVEGVPAGQGLLAYAHRTDSSFYPSIVFGIPGGRWYEDGPVRPYIADFKNIRGKVLVAGDLAREAVRTALDEAGLALGDVDFYAAHQPSPWFRRVTQEAIGIDKARAVDTFVDAGNLNGCNVPLVLYVAQKKSELRSGDLVAMFSAAPGITWTGAVLRWR